MVLRRLTIDGGFRLPRVACVLSGIDITKVPVFECGVGTVFSNRVWETAAPSTEPISARFADGPFLHPGGRTRAVTLESTGCTRTAFGVDAPIDGAHDIGRRLTVVVLCDAYLPDFLAMETPLLALAELYLDVTVPYSLSDLAPGAVRVRCPALQSVTLFGRENFTHPLHSHRVAMLGEMLNRGAQSAELRPVLKMFRVSFVQPVARKRLRSVFPVVDYDAKLDPKTLRLIEPRESQVERPFFVPNFVFRNA